MITFSIVTITFNAGACLPRTLQSVASQQYPHVEHLLVDGASADGTVGMIKEYMEQRAASPHHIRMWSEPDKGLYDAMNKGLARATGNYVLFLNAGDCLPNAHTLDDIVRRCRLDDYTPQTLPAVLYGYTLITDGNGKLLRKRHHTPPHTLSWRSFCRGMLVCHQAFYARTDIARSQPYDLHYRYSADVDWCIRVMKEAAHRHLPIVNTRLTVALYMEEGQSTVHHRASLKERFRVMKRHYGLPHTLLMHLWMVMRGVWGRLKIR
ncbi:MAG: glycosyltransferase family 2 protein [Prevotella sp.]